MCTAMELLIHSRRYEQTKRERKGERQIRERDKKKETDHYVYGYGVIDPTS